MARGRTSGRRGIVRRLAAIVEGAETRHLSEAGHMLALSHAATINPEIARHIARADELAGLSLGLNQIDDPQIDDPEPPLRLARRAASDRVGEEKS